MTELNDLKLCKAVTSHSTTFRGYVRARFETVFGEVETASDTGRKYSYMGTTAITPSNPNTNYSGYAGIAHTYCGVD